MQVSACLVALAPYAETSSIWHLPWKDVAVRHALRSHLGPVRNFGDLALQDMGCLWLVQDNDVPQQQLVIQAGLLCCCHCAVAVVRNIAQAAQLPGDSYLQHLLACAVYGVDVADEFASKCVLPASSCLWVWRPPVDHNGPINVCILPPLPFPPCMMLIVHCAARLGLILSFLSMLVPSLAADTSLLLAHFGSAKRMQQCFVLLHRSLNHQSNLACFARWQLRRIV